jgi:hypothetical protein
VSRARESVDASDETTPSSPPEAQPSSAMTAIQRTTNSI